MEQQEKQKATLSMAWANESAFSSTPKVTGLRRMTLAKRCNFSVTIFVFRETKNQKRVY
jgi:hypothetical protein